MDIYRFINSKDVADYLKSIGHTFTATQAACLVYLCDDATLDERTNAWETILQGMPDEKPNATDFRYEYRRKWSIHEIIRDVIRRQKEAREAFLDPENGLYFPYESRWQKTRLGA